jgi:deoxyribodipyrimidine photo-lyase
MCESLEDLHAATNKTLTIFHGDTIQVLTQIHKNSPFTHLYQNQDVTFYAQHRDAKIAAWCKKNNITFTNLEDYDLFPTHEGLVPSSQKPYTILSQYYDRYLKDLHVRKPTKTPIAKLAKLATLAKLPAKLPMQNTLSDIHKFYNTTPHPILHGGRTHALTQLKKIKNHKQYAKRRDFPADNDGTTKLSAYIKFGCVSIREVYWTCVESFKTRDHPLIRELIFRSHYYKNYSLRENLQRGQAYLDYIDKHIPWKYDQTLFQHWKSGTTGFPLVDAGMRQLSQTHWMHNRVRMLVASTLTKYLLIDWRDGERYFATQLIDYDPISNLAGWGFGSSTGFDNPQNLTRAPMNPFLQSKKYDPAAEYIKRYIPELASVTPRDIHNWGNLKVRDKYPNVTYPAPIIDQKEASARATKLWRSAAMKKHN